MELRFEIIVSHIVVLQGVGLVINNVCFVLTIPKSQSEDFRKSDVR